MVELKGGSALNVVVWEAVKVVQDRVLLTAVAETIVGSVAGSA